MGMKCNDDKRGNIMKQITLSAFIVLTLISIDLSFSMAYANPKNRLVNRLIELVQIHGDTLRELIQEEKKEE